MFKTYRKMHNAQISWIHAHPIKYVAYNAVALVVVIGGQEIYSRVQDRKIEREAAKKK